MEVQSLTRSESATGLTKGVDLDGTARRWFPGILRARKLARSGVFAANAYVGKDGDPGPNHSTCRGAYS